MAKTIVAKTSKAKPKYKRVTVQQYEAMKNIADAIIEQDQKQAEFEKYEEVKEARKKQPIDREKMEYLLQDVASLMNTLREFSINNVEDNSAPIVQVIAEKAGWLADRGIAMISGRPDVVGEYQDWIHYGIAPVLTLESTPASAQTVN